MALRSLPSNRQPAVAVCVAVHVRMTDDELGMAWWNQMNEPQRLEALRRADTDCPAEAWAWWKTHNAPASQAAGQWLGITRHGRDLYRSQRPHSSSAEALLDARRVAALLVRGGA